MTDQIQALTEAYHVVFDLIEDPALTALPFSDRVDDERALSITRSAIADTLSYLGAGRPRRFDGDGRTVENGGLRSTIEPAADDEIVRFV